MNKRAYRPPATESKLAPRFELKIRWRSAQHQKLPRKDKNKEKKMKASNFITNMNTVLSWLCCKKRRYNDSENTEIEKDKLGTTSSGNTGQDDYGPTDSQPQVKKVERQEKEEPWVRKYFQTATYHPGQFYSDTEEEDDDDDDPCNKEEEELRCTTSKSKIIDNIDKAPMIETMNDDMEEAADT